MTQSVPVVAQLGAAYSGDTISFKIFNQDGTQYANWTSTGFSEIGSTGTFLKANVTAPDEGGYIQFSNDGGSTVIGAVAEIEPAGISAAGIRSAVGLASANLDTQLSTIDGIVDSILADTGTDGVVISAAALQSVVDEWMAEDLESGKTAKQLLLDLWAIVVGDSAADDGDEPTSITYDSPDGSVQRTHAITETTRTVS